MTDPYSVLEVSRDASDDEIKKAYRNLSRKYHPDANINNPNKDQRGEIQRSPAGLSADHERAGIRLFRELRSI